MSSTVLIILVLTLSAIGYQLGRKRAYSLGERAGGVKVLHSRPTYYGLLTALWCAIPALLIFTAWQAFEPSIISNIIVSDLPEEIRTLPESRLNLVINDKGSKMDEAKILLGELE